MRRQIEEICENTRRNLEEKQAFLDADLSLKKMSTIICTNTLYLSAAINQCLGCNFRTMLNNYRVSYAKLFLRQTGMGSVNFSEFHARCGFRSKSAFYVAFKGRTGKTPLQFLNEARLQSARTEEKSAPGTPALYGGVSSYAYVTSRSL